MSWASVAPLVVTLCGVITVLAMIWARMQAIADRKRALAPGEYRRVWELEHELLSADRNGLSAWNHGPSCHVCHPNSNMLESVIRVGDGETSWQMETGMEFGSRRFSPGGIIR